jgi:hypothetical protein
MAVIVNGQRFLEADDVQGNPELAQQEATRQLNFANSEFERRKSETRVDEDGNPDPNGKFINVGRVSDLKENIASSLPAISVGTKSTGSSSSGNNPLDVTISGSVFAISAFWPHVNDPTGSPPGVPNPPPAPSDPFPSPPSGGTVIPPNNPTPPTIEPIDPPSSSSSGSGSGTGSDNQQGDGSSGSVSDTEPGASGQAPQQSDGGPSDSGQSQTPGSSNSVSPPSSAPNVQSAQGSSRPAGGTGSGDLTSPLEIEIDPRPNQLSDYASYTYNAELFMMSPKRYVGLLKKPMTVSHVLANYSFPVVRSGGMGRDGGEYFDIDFYIDNINLTNYATAPGARTSNTNVVQISFDINEPNGATFLERLYDAATNALEEEQNWIGCPYMLKITFKGYDDTGKEIIGAIKPKYIPIKINNLRFSVHDSGSVYKAEAIPYHHDVFNSIKSTIPINVQVSAGTIREVFYGPASIKDKVITESKRVDDTSDEDEEQQFKTVTTTKNIFGEPHTTLENAMNEFYKQKTKKSKNKLTGKEVPSSAMIADKVSFKFAEEIAEAKLQREKFDALNTPQPNQKAYKVIGGSTKGISTIDKANNLFKINAGTNIVSLLNYIIVASDYIDYNINDATSAPYVDGGAEVDAGIGHDGLRWFKIIPQIKEFLGWDSKEARYKFHVQYTVMVNRVYYEDFPWVPETKPKGNGVHKLYNYIFSGENTEVQGFRLDFEAAYYQAHTIGTGIPKADKNVGDVVGNSQVKDRSTGNENISNNESLTEKRKQDFFTNIMQDGRDLIAVDIDILGDPAFFPTGDALFQPQGNNNKVYSKPFLPDGTINYDLTSPFVQVNLRTPTDYNPETGFMDFSTDKRYSSSQFNGVYRVLTVKSTFSGGVFSQSLHAVRTKIQPIDGKLGRSKKSIIGQERKYAVQQLSNLLTQLVRANSNPLESFVRTGVTRIGTLMDDINTNIKANRIQRLANEQDQGRFREGIGDEEIDEAAPTESNITTRQRTNTDDILIV